MFCYLKYPRNSSFSVCYKNLTLPLKVKNISSRAIAWDLQRVEIGGWVDVVGVCQASACPKVDIIRWFLITTNAELSVLSMS